MKLAICDDNEQELQRLYSLVNDYIQRRSDLGVEIDCYTSVEVLSRIQPERYQLFLLDVLMPNMTGIEFARKLRENGGSEAIIFTTFSPDFALDAFSVKAVQYLLKPVRQEALFSALDQAFLFLQQQRACSFTVSTQVGVQCIYYHNIVYAECVKHYAYFHMVDGKVISSRTLRQSFVSYIASLLSDNRFMQTHHSFVVNKQHIIRFNSRELMVLGGKIIPIAKDKAADIKRSYLAYLDGDLGENV